MGSAGTWQEWRNKAIAPYGSNANSSITHPNTTSAHGRLLLNILGSIAAFEQELIRSRTSEGRARAKARGVQFGRKPKLTAHQVQEALARRQAGEALSEIGRSYNVSHSTISRL